MCFSFANLLLPMKLIPEAGNFKLDGGAMFGLSQIPLVTNQSADSNNMIDMAARCLLIENGNRLTLIDNGMGQNRMKIFDIIICGAIFPWTAPLKRPVTIAMK